MQLTSSHEMEPWIQTVGKWTAKGEATNGLCFTEGPDIRLPRLVIPATQEVEGLSSSQPQTHYLRMILKFSSTGLHLLKAPLWTSKLDL
ncbi:hypothetical protein LEMLEM_LOCUS120 [Lemmus lemmus]